MYKLIVVDDERLIRSRLKNQLNWQAFDIAVIGEYDNALDALEAIARDKPDIMLADIRMPGISGLELLGGALQINSEMKTVFITGYSEFDYARTALDLKASAYLLKPVDTDELKKVIGNIVIELRKLDLQKYDLEQIKVQIRESVPLLKEKLLNELLLGGMDENSLQKKAESLHLRLFGVKYLVWLAEIDDFALSFGHIEDIAKQARMLDVHYAISDYLQAESYAQMTRLNECRFALIVGYDENVADEALFNNAVSSASRLIHTVKERTSLGITVSVGSVAASLEGIRASYANARLAMEYKVFSGKEMVIVYREIESRVLSDTDMINMPALEDNLFGALELLEAEKTDGVLEEIFSTVLEHKNLRAVFIRDFCIRLLARLNMFMLDKGESQVSIFGGDNLIWDKLTRFETIVDIQQWMKNVFRMVIEHLNQKRGGRNSKIIEEAIMYMLENYSGEISLKRMSRKLGYSPNYLGFLFKKETGVSIQDHILHLRMDKAKELLKGSSLKVYQIAQMVGYKNITYFCNQFKLYSGVTPREYREMV